MAAGRWMAVMGGGMLGALARVGALEALAPLLPAAGGMPLALLCVNMAGSLLLGLLQGRFLHQLSEYAYVFWGTGFCGGFTTFSAFSGETLGLLQSGRTGGALLNAALSVAGCALAAGAGFLITAPSEVVRVAARRRKE
ncbi:MAG TPA: CrcB family protein [Candidatus Avidesulfovibrio excrementigallinarum]|nr:CrcB family protein [Candidatus Avidesulfovibrio excrementigallinarum]